MLQAGDIVGAYQIESQIGAGGMATVYRAYHERLDRHVAIKIMHQTFLQDETFRQRFAREARIVAKLEHPNIVPIYDYNEHNGVPYLVMKYIQGLTLKRVALKRGLTLEQTAHTLTIAAEALDYAHRQGVLHRDIKPSNILLDGDDRPYITDFGLARIAEIGASTISKDMMLGTPHYISPEQAQGETDVDHRTDIYSLAVILYELITGQVPFTADTPYAIVHGHIYKPIVPPSHINGDLNADVDVVMAKALAKRPDDRFSTAVSMMQAFRAALRTSDVRDPEASVIVTPPPETRRTPQPPPADVFDPVDAVDETLGEIDQVVDEVVDDVMLDSRGRRVRVEGSLDLGSIDWRGGMRSLTTMIEERIEEEMRERGLSEASLTDEGRIRRRVEERIKQRNELAQHIGVYLVVNGVLWLIFMLSGGGFPWPIFPTFFWGIGVVAQFGEYYNEYGAGAAKREALIEREVEREMARVSGAQPAKRKGKNKDKRRSERLEDPPGQVRLNEDGELTDSFVQEVEDQYRRR